MSNIFPYITFQFDEQYSSYVVCQVENTKIHNAHLIAGILQKSLLEVNTSINIIIEYEDEP